MSKCWQSLQKAAGKMLVMFENCSPFYLILYPMFLLRIRYAYLIT